jgi:flagellar motor switch protein FliM
MSALNQELAESDVRDSSGKISGKSRSVQPCNFRSAGRLSNENARELTKIHRVFARNLAGALADYAGADLKVKLLALDQAPVRDFVESVPAFSYLASFPLRAASSTLLLECGINLIFPIIDLLLGGMGVTANDPRELSEIEDEIMQDLMLLFARQAVGAWGMTDLPLAATVRVEPAALSGVFPVNEKVTLVKFEIEVASITGTFQMVFPSALVNVLIKQSKAGHPQKKSTLQFFPATSLRERILDCDVTVAAALPSIRISVRDLLGLQLGCVLKLRAPVRTPCMLTVGGMEIFEAVPVRNGTQKAAQVGRRVQPPTRGKE